MTDELHDDEVKQIVSKLYDQLPTEQECKDDFTSFMQLIRTNPDVPDLPTSESVMRNIKRVERP
jgi:hypothetical protein